MRAKGVPSTYLRHIASMITESAYFPFGTMAGCTGATYPSDGRCSLITQLW